MGNTSSNTVGTHVLARELRIGLGEIKCWERDGLLVPRKNAKGIREFTENDIRCAKIILRYRVEFGITLSDVCRLFSTKEGIDGIATKARCIEVLNELAAHAERVS